MGRPAVICLSGKRKCGKDFVANLIAKRLEGIGCRVIVCGVSHPLKEEYAELNGIDGERLKSDLLYKEIYRRDMIIWSEKLRENDAGYFCRKVLARCDSFDVIIVPDCRRLSDIEFFKVNCGSRIRLVRIECALPIRKKRGFEFIEGIDDQITECGLDEYDGWDIIINNDIPTVNESLPSTLETFLTRLSCEIIKMLGN
ncbi:unnamed protein product [Thelazia callipaeda]|uniref:Phosphomevalonate kinase n=1 Tax=Thelazia callipaeda TaxID=103827 RepID=A0A0N5CYU0_THECL|nr:unnamed protein product [Thelazia callipaeda]